MIVYYKGYRIECQHNTAWDNSFKGKTLTAFKDKDRFVLSQWWPKSIRDGIKYGKAFIDTLDK